MAKLFDPISIGTLNVENRFVRSATAEGLSDEEGRPLPQLTDMYRALAEGGVGLIITGHAFVHPSGRCRKVMSGMHHDGMIPLWAEVTAAVHEVGGKIAVQLNHGGRQCDPAAVEGPLLAPSSIPLNADSPRPLELNEQDIHGLIRAYGEAAGCAKEAGFDAVQVHAAHGYLISSFNSPASNRRHDAWGGSPARRLRFFEEVVSATRDIVGDEYPVFAKLATVDFCRDGLTEDDGVEIVSHLADMGLDAVEISGGIGPDNARPGILREDQEAYFLPIARKARDVTDLPIMLVGGLRSTEVMGRILDEGTADMVSLCRPLIREPDLPNRLRDGQDKATCISCNQCAPREGELGISCHYRWQETRDEEQ